MIDELTKRKHMTQLAAYRRELFRSPKLKFLFLELTQLCNEHCRHCGSRCGDGVPADTLTKSEIFAFLKKISEQFDLNDLQLCITGGEPLLREDFFEIMNYAHFLGFHWGMTTNGTLIDAQTAEKLEKAGMGTVSVSLDGLRETNDWFRQKQGGFDLVLNGVRELLKRGTFRHVQVTTVVTKKNIGELDELYKLLSSEKVHSWRVINIEPIGRAKEQPELLLEPDDYRRMFNFIKEKRSAGGMEVTYGCSHYLGEELEREVRKWYFLCNAGIYTASVMHNGDIGACLDIERRPELIQGNIRRDDFKNVWENRFKAFRGDTRKCRGCKHYLFCGGDSFHTWNFDENKPDLCFKGILF